MYASGHRTELKGAELKNLDAAVLQQPSDENSARRDRDRRRPGLGAAGRIRARRAAHRRDRRAGGTGVRERLHLRRVGRIREVLPRLRRHRERPEEHDRRRGEQQVAGIPGEPRRGGAERHRERRRVAGHGQPAACGQLAGHRPARGRHHEAGRDHRRPGADDAAQAHAAEHPAGRARRHVRRAARAAPRCCPCSTTTPTRTATCWSPRSRRRSRRSAMCSRSTTAGRCRSPCRTRPRDPPPSSTRPTTAAAARPRRTSPSTCTTGA